MSLNKVIELLITSRFLNVPLGKRVSREVVFTHQVNELT